MTREAFQRGDWAAVIDAHPLESHDPEEWLRYGVALLQTLKPGQDASCIRSDQRIITFLLIKLESSSESSFQAVSMRPCAFKPVRCNYRIFEVSICERIMRKALNISEYLLVVIHTCTQYETERCQHILETWASTMHPRAKIICATDNPNSTLPAASYMGPYKNGPTYHPETAVRILEHFESLNSEFDWFMMIDDDSYLVIDNLVSFLDTVDERKPYLIADFVNWPVLYENWREVAKKLPTARAASKL